MILYMYTVSGILTKQVTKNLSMRSLPCSYNGTDKPSREGTNAFIQKEQIKKTL